MSSKAVASKDNVVNQLRHCPTATLCNAHPKIKAMSSRIQPLFRGATIGARAKTAAISPGQNAAIHRAISTAIAGQVLVVDGGGSLSYGPFGDILAFYCLKVGITGLIIDGTVRDSEAITEMRFPVFCLGTHPAPTGKTDPGEIDACITCGDVTVCPDDIVIADSDGIVIVPDAISKDVYPLVKAIVLKENEIKKRIEKGESTCEIFGIEP